MDPQLDCGKCSMVHVITCRLDLHVKALSHLDDLSSICRRMKNLSKTLAYVEYVVGKFCIR